MPDNMTDGLEPPTISEIARRLDTIDAASERRFAQLSTDLRTSTVPLNVYSLQINEHERRILGTEGRLTQIATFNRQLLLCVLTAVLTSVGVLVVVLTTHVN